MIINNLNIDNIKIGYRAESLQTGKAAEKRAVLSKKSCICYFKNSFE